MQNKNKNPNEKKGSFGSYKINKAAVDRLVNADKKTYAKTNVDPGRQYRSKGFIDKIPSWIKALFIKFWFNGAVCFFFIMGLGMLIPATRDMIVVVGVVLGMVNDLLVNNTFHFFAITPGSNNKWMMFPQRKFWTFFANILYCTFITYIVVRFYININLAIGTDGSVPFFVEPITFGLIIMGVDMLFVGIKNLIIKIISDARDKAKDM